MPGVYLSYPFCAQKCTYCNFASDVLPQSLSVRYLEALRGEILAHKWEWTPETVYLGGGTPSMMEAADLRSVLECIPGRPWVEATIEAAPGSITAEKASAWAAHGINRVSLGVQSFVEQEIRRTGRKHTAAMVAEEMEMLREAGIVNRNIDLIAGLSGQTGASWGESLDWIERLRPEHVSVYMLEVDEDSRLGKEMLFGGVRYGAADTPSDDAVAAMYETAVERLAAMGLLRYEISNFGLESRHNLKYWKLEPYVGFGADAHSFDGRVRRGNAESVEEYLSGRSLTLLTHKGIRRVAVQCGTPTPIPVATADERFFVGLRLMEGIRPTEEEWTRHKEPISRFVAEGLLESENGILRLTNRGVLLSNEVFQEFLAA